MAFDVITVGGGFGATCLAWALSKEGLRVLVLEREKQFRDRVRGEGILPWGVNEARDLGIYDLLANSGGIPIRTWTSHSWAKRPPRDLVQTTPRGSHCLNFFHPDMQEVLWQAAGEAGATMRRGASVKGVEAGSPPKLTVEYEGGKRETISARLIVGADGRASRVATWLGFETLRDPERLAIAGVLLEGTNVPEHSEHIFRNSNAGEGALLFPLGPDRTRTYFIYRKTGERRGLSGTSQVPHFIRSCIDLGIEGDWLGEARSAGPLAEFEGADYWNPSPYRDGVALIGAAAASNDPSWGNGLSVTLRDVRTLKDCLLTNGDWDDAGHAYAKAHDRDFGVINRVTRWLTELLYEVGPVAEARREKAFALMNQDRSRNPDYIALGPDSASDERARRRMFGEE